MAQNLHSCASSILHACLDRFLDAQHADAEAAIIPIRRFLTAMIHHCAKASQTSVLNDVIITRLSSVAESRDQHESALRILLVAQVPCSVRQGSRLSGSDNGYYIVYTKILTNIPPTFSERIIPTHRLLHEISLPPGSSGASGSHCHCLPLCNYRGLRSMDGRRSTCN